MIMTIDVAVKNSPIKCKYKSNIKNNNITNASLPAFDLRLI